MGAFKKSWPLVVAIAASLPAVPAAAGEGNSIVYGAGTDTCGDWLQERKTGNWYDKGQWMLGFVSAVSVFDVIDLKLSNANAFAAFADKYCAEHPLDNFSEAVRAMLHELRTDKPKGS